MSCHCKCSSALCLNCSCFSACSAHQNLHAFLQYSRMLEIQLWLTWQQNKSSLKKIYRKKSENTERKSTRLPTWSSVECIISRYKIVTQNCGQFLFSHKHCFIFPPSFEVSSICLFVWGNTSKQSSNLIQCKYFHTLFLFCLLYLRCIF